MMGQPERRRNDAGRVVISGVATLLLTCGILSAGAVRADAQAPTVKCGDVLSGNNTYVLTNDLVCTTQPALTLVGPAVLKLNGWSVTCATTIPTSNAVTAAATEGIQIDGKGAKLLGAGTRVAATANPTPTNLVAGCDENVIIEGDGKHFVQGVTSTNSSDGGFIVSSNHNRLDANVARDNGDQGFTVTGNYNKLTRNIATDSAENGFKIDGMCNRLVLNSSHDNIDNGFNVEHGVSNILDSNVAEANGDDGFLLAGGGNKNVLMYNQSMKNGNGAPSNGGDGFEIEGDSNLVTFNLAERNREHGIHAEQSDLGTADEEIAEKNEIRKNQVRGSGVMDMLTDIPGCGTNKWKQNIFDTSNDTCIH
jgi:parallel beta-helix repeat protein